MKTNSNSYTIIYSVVIVVIVAFLLAFVFQALKPAQDANVALDQKKQILNSLNIRNLTNEQAEAKYKDVVLSEKNVKGNLYYDCKVNGKHLVVLPLKGMGLWGGISGFLAVDDNAVVYGAYFNHESETAGLGAEIKDNAEWQKKFQGKKIFKEGSDKVALSVQKKIDDPATQVDAVTGATLTSNGVSNMLHEGIANYKSLFRIK
jgi:Na+-transporting NADH:ubiquinone oxidoreductase subunit C